MTPLPPLFESAEHDRLRVEVGRFARAEIAPFAHAWDEAGEFPRALYARAGEVGFLGIGYPEAYGGAGGDLSHVLAAGDALILEGKSAGVSAGLGSHQIALPPILAGGSEALKQRVVPPVLRGERIAALAVTEPGAGSDVASISTRAARDGDHYVVTGAKMFITSGCRADVLTTAVRTGGDGAGGVSLLVIDRAESRDGITVSRKLAKMGWWASDTAEIAFDGCRVPAGNLLGEENGAFRLIMQNFAAERLLIAWSCVAIAELAYRETVAYAKERKAFGKTLMGFQVTRHKLADMAMRIAAAQALAHEVLQRHLRGEFVGGLVAMAKNAATDACSFVCDQAVQIHGGAGYLRESVVERLYRDARLYSIGGGTREIMNEIIAKTEGY